MHYGQSVLPPGRKRGHVSGRFYACETLQYPMLTCLWENVNFLQCCSSEGSFDFEGFEE